MHPPHEMNTCKACHNSFTGKYCNICGEKVVSEHDKSMAHVAEEVFHFISHLDGTLVNTLRAIFTKPGQLSLDYCNGIRKKYFKPVSFFLLLVVLYLLFPLFRGLNMPLEGHFDQTFYGYYVKKVVAGKLAAEHIDLPTLARKFDVHSEKISKLLLVIIIPLCALPLWWGFRRQRKYFYDHFILSAEINSFFLIASFFIWPLLQRILLLFPFMRFLDGPHSDNISGGISVTVSLTYCAFAFKRFYETRPLLTIIKALLFSALQLFIIFILYRFIQFNVIMWMV